MGYLDIFFSLITTIILAFNYVKTNPYVLLVINNNMTICVVDKNSIGSFQFLFH